MEQGPIERETVGDLRLSIYQDEEPMSPREWDQLGVMVHWHRRYDLGDRKLTDGERAALEHGGWTGLRKHLERQHGALIGPVVSIGLLDHSGLHVWAGGGAHWSDSAGWDSGTVGFVYATLERARELGVPESDEEIKRQLAAEIEEFDHYVRGDVYGYVIDRLTTCNKGQEHAEHVDSCWGFYSAETVRDAAHEALDAIRATAAQEAS